MTDGTHNDASDTESLDVAPKRATGRRVAVVLAMIFVAAAVVFHADTFILELLGLGDLWFLFFMVGLPVAAVGACFLLVLFVVKLARWRNTRFWNALTYLALLACLYSAPIVPNVHAHVLGFSCWARFHIDIPAAAAWAEQFNPPTADPNGHSNLASWNAEVPVESLPPTIQSFVRAHGPRLYYDRPEKALVMFWGGGFGHWGVTIGRGVGSPSSVLGTDAYAWDREGG